MKHLKRTFILLALTGAALVACNTNPPPDPPDPPPPEVLTTLNGTEWATVKYYSDPVPGDDFLPFDSIIIVFYRELNGDAYRERCQANHHTEIYDSTSSEEGGTTYSLPPTVSEYSYIYDYSYDSISQSGTITNLGTYVLNETGKSFTMTYTDGSTAAIYNRVK
ncbi:MAG: hypothetical protein LBT04_01260 [Prevotellaceae bacterium]|jgi:hypothetical protein|nr:hypothetical protein [Prevotellaceae bacterium]